MSEAGMTEGGSESGATQELQPGPLPSPGADPFARPLAEVLGRSSEDEDEGDDVEDLEDLHPPQSASAGRPPKDEASSKGKVPGRGGGGGPKMRKGQVDRLSKAKGVKTSPQEWAELMRAEARKACDAAGVPLDGAESAAPNPVGADASPEAAAAAGADGAAEASSNGTTGHRFTAAHHEDLIYGQPAAQVLEVMPITGGFWGMVAKRCAGSRWDFAGEREMTAFPGTPFERTIRCDSERRLAELSAVLLVKHGSKLTGKVEAPETLFVGTLFFAFGPQAIENAWEMVRKVGGWWRRRRGGE